MVDQQVVFVVDDDEAVCQSLRWLIEAVGLPVETYLSAQAFLESYRPERPGCLVLDVRMPGMSGLDLLETLRAEGMEIPTIVISGHADVSTAVRAMKRGAIDFIEKPFDDRVLLDKIREALALDTQFRQEQVDLGAVLQRYHTLSPRERQVMKMVVDGLSSKEIAARIQLSHKTVEVHRSHLMAKLGVSNLAELVRLSMRIDAYGVRTRRTKGKS